MWHKITIKPFFPPLTKSRSTSKVIDRKVRKSRTNPKVFYSNSHSYQEMSKYAYPIVNHKSTVQIFSSSHSLKAKHPHPNSKIQVQSPVQNNRERTWKLKSRLRQGDKNKVNNKEDQAGQQAGETM